MRAVNLIPPEDRRGRRSFESGGAFSYVVVGALLVVLAMVTLLVLTNNTINEKKTEVAQLERDRAAAQARAASLQSFADFRSMQEQRTATVASLAQSRFDWERVLRELAIVLPSDVWLTELTGTVSPSVQVDDGASLSIRSSVEGPALEIVGCTVSQQAVGSFVATLRDIDGVTRVSVQKSALPELSEGAATSSDGGTASSSEDCQTRDFIARFEIVAAFDEVPVPDTTATVPPTTTDSATEDSTASQDATQEGVAEGQEAAEIAPGS